MNRTCVDAEWLALWLENFNFERGKMMLKRCSSVLLAGLLIISVSPAPALAKSKVEKEAEKAQKVKAGILSLGLGPEACIKVKLRDKTKLEGYIREAGNDQFVITNAKTGAETAVDYAQVSTAQGHNLSKGAKIAIGVGIAAAIVIVVLVIAFHGFTAS